MNENEVRAKLEEEHGQVWTTSEAQSEFDFEGFGAPYVVVTRKSDGVRGTLEFTHMPRFYFGFRADN